MENNKTKAQVVAIKAKMGGKKVKEELNAWGQDAKTAKAERSRLRKEKAFKSFNKHAEERYRAGY